MKNVIEKDKEVWRIGIEDTMEVQKEGIKSKTAEKKTFEKIMEINFPELKK